MSNTKSTPATIERREFVAELVKACPDALVIPGLGSSNYDLFAAGDRPNNFYMWGAMGGAVSIGLGLAIAQPERQVLVVTGDGEMLMGMGSLATVGSQQPKNLTIVVLDNGHFGETGMQHSHTSLGTDLVAVAKGCSISSAEHVQTMAGITAIQKAVTALAGPSFFQVHVKAIEDPRALPTRDGVYVKNRFRELLGFGPL
jgi:thiamine pyrophosphate-dependent acetolactate synthase large subunit-like protein